MKIRTDRADLVERLNTIQGIIPSNTPKPILADLRFYTESDRLVAEATDLELSGRVFIPKVEISEPGEMAIPCARLLSIVKEIPEDFVNLSTTGDDPYETLIESRGYEFKIMGHNPAEFPRTEELEGTQPITLSRTKLLDSLRRVAVAVSRDPTRYQLNGVFLEITDGKIQFTATDGKRLTHDFFKPTQNAGVEISAILPNQAVDVFLRVLSSQTTQDETVRLNLSETHVSLSTEDTEISSTLIDGLFPDYRTILPGDARVKVQAKRSALLSAAKSAALTTDKQTSTVLFRIASDALVVESNSKDIGASKIEIPVECSGEGMEIRFNPVFLIDALRTFEEENVSLELTEAAKPTVVRSAQNYVHLVMPLVTK